MLRLLDLFCGAGGAAMGYYNAGFNYIVGVDIVPQPHYPFSFYQADALEFPLGDFDVIHASPPCQAYIQRNKNLTTRHPKLIEPLRDRLQQNGSPFVIENVPGAPLFDPIMLCGTMFDLRVLRHRLFEFSLPLNIDLSCNHQGRSVASGDFAGVYARGGKGHRHGRDERGNKVRDASSADGPAWSDAMGIDWMTDRELTQAIPPAYTAYLGERLILTLT